MDGDPPQLDQVDYVLLYKDRERDKRKAELRDSFREAMEEEGLRIQEERSEELVYVKIFVPFEKLCKEAEKIDLEMPLKGVGTF